jgi:phage-related protein (TIGR01555 family)
MAKNLKRGSGLQTKWHINPHVIKDAQEPEDISYKPVKTLGYNGTDAWTIQDGALETAGVYTMINNGALAGVPSFMGYMALAQLSQDGVIKAGVDLRADEMTRRWIEFQYQGEGGDDLIEQIEADINRLHVQKVFRDAAQMCGFYGGCLVYIDVGDVMDEDLRIPLGADGDTFRPDSIKGLKIIEPFYIAPGRYSCYNPIDKDYFVPQTWLINGREIHASRFLYFAEDKPPTILLPSYNFFGVPLAQTVLDSVIGFEQSSKSAARMLSKYASTVFKTDMNEVLSGGSGNEIQKRVQYFAMNRDNDGVMLIDKESEDIELSNHALGGVTDIVRQQMEIVAAMFGEPAVKLWGISPGGFNATGESDMQAHYDHVNAVQERILRDPLEYLVKLLQLNRFGTVDSNLDFEFIPLSDKDERLQAEVQKIKVDSMSQLFDRGIISGEEARHVLATDPESGFDDIDESSVPEPPDLAIPVDPPGGEIP